MNAETVVYKAVNPLNAELNRICLLLALLGAHHIFQVSGLKVNGLFYAKAAVFLGEYFLLPTEQNCSLAQGTVRRFGKEDKSKECGAVRK